MLQYEYEYSMGDGTIQDVLSGREALRIDHYFKIDFETAFAVFVLIAAVVLFSRFIKG